jgi:predicted molibdopterin-dependent oxidoreductase YjgC
VTGSFFTHPEGKDFVRLFEIFNAQIDKGVFKKELIQEHAQNFDESKFENKIQEIVQKITS